jgi:hypothetical protein
MAVAPALSVGELYSLLLDFEGDLAAARQQAIRASQAPSSTHIKQETSAAANSLQQAPRLADDMGDDDEIMIKIDPNDPFLEWVGISKVSERLC